MCRKFLVPLFLLLSQEYVLILQAYVEFPKVFEEVETILTQIKNFQQNASKMSATLADNAGLLRSLIVQAEDARIIGHRLV